MPEECTDCRYQSTAWLPIEGGLFHSLPGHHTSKPLAEKHSLSVWLDFWKVSFYVLYIFLYDVVHITGAFLLEGSVSRTVLVCYVHIHHQLILLKSRWETGNSIVKCLSQHKFCLATIWQPGPTSEWGWWHWRASSVAHGGSGRAECSPLGFMCSPGGPVPSTYKL